MPSRACTCRGMRGPKAGLRRTWAPPCACYCGGGAGRGAAAGALHFARAVELGNGCEESKGRPRPLVGARQPSWSIGRPLMRIGATGPEVTGASRSWRKADQGCKGTGEGFGLLPCSIFAWQEPWLREGSCACRRDRVKEASVGFEVCRTQSAWQRVASREGVREGHQSGGGQDAHLGSACEVAARMCYHTTRVCHGRRPCCLLRAAVCRTRQGHVPLVFKCLCRLSTDGAVFCLCTSFLPDHVTRRHGFVCSRFGLYVLDAVQMGVVRR